MNPSLLPLPCYLNGEFTTLPNAKISVMDRGFIFGDGIYEVVPAYGGHPFRFDQHMARLERSLKEVRIDSPMDRAGWRAVIQRLMATYAESQGKGPHDLDQLVYIQVTRGVAMREHMMLQGLQPTVFASTNLMKPPSDEQRAQGVACVSAADFRWEKAHIKSTSLLGAVFARQISADAGAVETVMFRGENLSEAAASNVWVIKNGIVMGPPKNRLVLEGIRYGLIEELCQAEGIPFQLRVITRAEVLDADELLLSSATKEVLPITTLDGQPVGHAAGRGRPGPVYARLHAAYQRAKQGRDGLMNLPTGDATRESLIDYPSKFPIKVMGLQAEGFVAAVVAVARHFDPSFDEATVELRPSSTGKYLGITLVVLATSRDQLDELYRTLSTHPMVKVVL